MLRFGNRIGVAASLIAVLSVAIGSVAAMSPREQMTSLASASERALRVSPPAAEPDSSPDPVPPPSGHTAPVGDRGPWKQVFLDDFGSDVALGEFPSRVSSQWTAYPSPWNDTSRNGMYAPERVVSISDGVLRKDLRSENGQPLVAALQPKLTGVGPGGMLYGRYEVRARFDRLPGYKVAWLLWPSGSGASWPEHGEVDWPEADLGDDFAMGFVHHWGAKTGSDQSHVRADVSLQDWHTYTIEWTPGADQRGLIVLYLDGVPILRVTDRVPQAPMRWVIQTETQLGGGPPQPGVRGAVEIDWAAAWAYRP